MQLSLQGIGHQVGPATFLYPLDLSLESGAVTVLLGATQAGKTTLMRLMAGLDAPSSGLVWFDGTDVTGVPVRKRNVAMVYQQFINYTSMTVADNIASPLRLRKESDIERRVLELARKLHIEPFLERMPGELSGGQQQRVALARALAKDAPLMLFDEPLVNLDYKLREELRDELTQLFASGDSTVVYATTEPTEALLLTSRKRRRQAAEEGLDVQLRGKFVHARADVRRAAQPQRRGDVVGHAHRRIVDELLVDHGHIALAHRHIGHVAAGHEDPARMPMSQRAEGWRSSARQAALRRTAAWPSS
jgi:ABC-type nitrate/sulfonate/bicarbonate transport system ATPase subunit